MFTQAMPAFANSMRSGQMFPAMQALGNCQQPLTHRGGVNFAAGPGLNQRGVYTSQPWDPADYQFPGGSQFADFGGMNVNWNAGNRYDSQFYFPTDQFFTQNQFFGGPQVHIDGRMQVDIVNANTYEGDTVNVSNVTTQVINGNPVAGLPGKPGEAGRDGRPGAPGFPGRPGKDGVLPQGQFAELLYLWGIKPRVDFQPVPVQKPHRYVKGAWVRPELEVAVPTNAIKGGSVSVQPDSTSFSIPTDAISGGSFDLSPTPVAVTIPLSISFDPDNCTVSIDSTTTVYAFPSAPSAQSITGTAASVSSVTVASTAVIAATVSVTAADTVTVIAATTAASVPASNAGSLGVLVKGADDDFWGLPDPVEVARNPILKGVIPQPARQVFQK